jgi:HAD superfamily hydrolase (TIGR01509 family)
VPPTKLRAIIFDIGRVLIRVDVARIKSALADGLSLSPQELWSAIENDPLWRDWQEGRLKPRDWHLHLSKRLGSSLSFEKFSEAWNLALDPQPMQDSAIFQRLSKQYRLGLLSNTDHIHLAHMEPKYDFFPYFPVRIYSCSVGASKPDPLIYQHALRGLRTKATEALYIDDIPAYVEAAQRLGMSGIIYRSPDQLREDLRNFGIVL